MSQLKSEKPYLVWFTSFVVGLIIFTFLVWWLYFKVPGSVSGSWVYFLPYLNCTLNSLTACFLICGYRAIKNGKVSLHKALMISAGFTSAFFLISYLTYHHYVGDTSFTGTGWIRTIYFSILVSHIFLSMIQVPCILATFYFAFSGNWKQHKRAAKVTFPVWLYVSVTGVVIFIMLKLLM